MAVTADLHIHSALSPCAAPEMKPPEVLLTAERAGLSLVGIVDHSTGGNAGAFLRAAPAFDVNVLVGLEVESAEGVHLLALFDRLEALEAFEGVISQHLPALPWRADVLGEQHLLNEWGDVLGMDERLLIIGTDLGIEYLADAALDLGGTSIPAHIDRAANGLLPTLGFIPPKLKVDLLEVSWRMTRGEARQRWPELAGRGLITSSDAHVLEDIGRGRVRLPAELALPASPLGDWAKVVAAHLVG